MGRHRRSGRVNRAGSAAVKAAAVMGVAGTLALGINSASDGPVHTQAMSDEAVPGEASAAAEDLSASSAQHDDLIPTAMSTEHAAEPKLIDDRAEQIRSSRSAAEKREAVQQQAVSTSTSSANFGHEQTQQPTEVAPPSESNSSEPSATTAPEPSTTPSGGGDGQQDGGGLVGGVVGGVGGVLGGLLG
ncbi:hypothetical protein M1E25_01005 [Streptomyces sp. MTZ3.1]|uniref:Extensin n=2 Tax=Streptomyces meridianus TaxID=2938945 RepID=A0ABT0X1C0_9ACTN|nr:hypothetical protein [Streptomyces meridianus]